MSSKKVIAIGADHGGYPLKKKLLEVCKKADTAPKDVGCFCKDPCDYPLYAEKVSRLVSSGKAERGLLLCKSGAGMAIVANKFPGVRAAVCQSIRQAKHSREHNDTNVLVLGAEYLNTQRAKAILLAWLETSFTGGRHARRVQQIRSIEKRIRR
jgi:RpiB/LacA/LacB family sugar-phosphate isomerase